MKTYTYYVYHIAGTKIGCTTELEERMSDQGFTEWEILWQEEGDYEFGWTAGDKELELQKEYGYEVDTCHYQISRENRRRGGLIGGRTRGTQMKGEGNPRYGVSLSDETKSKISESLIGHTYNIGYTHTTETKRKISETLTGVPLSEEHRKAIADGQRGIPKPKTACRLCGKLIPNHILQRHENSTRLHK